MILKPHPRGKSGLRDVELSTSISYISIRKDCSICSHTYSTDQTWSLGTSVRCLRKFKRKGAKAALKSVKFRELSRASRILTSASLTPPSSLDTVEKLKAKHPVQSEAPILLASNFQTRERAKHANSSLDQVDTKMISEIALLSQSASTTQISVVNSDWLSNNWLC